MGEEGDADAHKIEPFTSPVRTGGDRLADTIERHTLASEYVNLSHVRFHTKKRTSVISPQCVR